VTRSDLMIWAKDPLRGHPMVSIYGAEETYAEPKSS
jgi:hypothetical protein